MRRLFVVAAVLVSLAFACGIDVRGASPNGAADAAADAEAGAEGHVAGGGDDQEGVGFDAGGDASCDPTRIDDSLDSIDGTKWITQEINNQDRPAPIPSGSKHIISLIGGDRASGSASASAEVGWHDRPEP